MTAKLESHHDLLGSEEPMICLVLEALFLIRASVNTESRLLGLANESPRKILRVAETAALLVLAVTQVAPENQIEAIAKARRFWNDNANPGDLIGFQQALLVGVTLVPTEVATADFRGAVIKELRVIVVEVPWAPVGEG